MNINSSVDWYVDRSVVAEVVRGDNSRGGSNVGAGVGIIDGGLFDLEVGDEVGYGDGISVDKCFKGLYSVMVGGSVYWGVDIGIVAGSSSYDVITFGINYGYEMSSSG